VRRTTSIRAIEVWSALLFVWWRTLLNRILGWSGRLKQPKYALGTLFGVGYFGFLGWSILGGPDGTGPDPAAVASVGTVVAPLILATMAFAWWVSGRTHMALAFTPAEVQFLFQAPIRRVTLLRFKLARAQAAVVPLSLLFAVVLSRAVPLGWPPVALSTWMLLTTMHLHQVAAGLSRAGGANQGRAGLARMAVPVVVLAGGVASLAWALLPLTQAVGSMGSGAEAMAALQVALARPSAVVVLMPFQIALSPLLASEFTEWMSALVGALALLVLHYIWVVRTDARFEEAAAEAGVELQSITTAMKEGRLGALRLSTHEVVARPWFRLSPVGRPAMAIFWKSFTAFTRSFGITQVLSLIATFLGAWVLMLFVADDAREASLAAMALPAILVPTGLFLGPLFLRNDLRTDLQRLEVIRTLPLSGRDLVAAEIASSAVSLTLVLSFFTLLAFVFYQISTLAPPTPWRPWVGLGLVLVMLPPLAGLATGIQNVIAVMFPAWAPLGPTQAQGIDQMGVMILSMLIAGVLMLVGLLAPAIVAGTVALRTFAVLGPWTAVPTYLALWGTFVGEVLVLVVLLGDAFDELDPTAEGLLR
jgi:Putative ABC exporter